MFHLIFISMLSPVWAQATNHIADVCLNIRVERMEGRARAAAPEADQWPKFLLKQKTQIEKAREAALNEGLSFREFMMKAAQEDKLYIPVAMFQAEYNQMYEQRHCDEASPAVSATYTPKLPTALERDHATDLRQVDYVLGGSSTVPGTPGTSDTER